MIVSYRDKRTADFAVGKRVKTFSGIERAARLKLDRVEAAHILQDLAALPGNRFEALKGEGPVPHPNQRSMADRFRVAREITGTDECRNRGLSLRSTLWDAGLSILANI